MPKVVSFTPPWLSRPSPGASVFSGAIDTSASQTPRKDVEYSGPSRLLAKRGNEVFTVVDNQIRWADLAHLKDTWQQSSAKNNVHYKVLKVPVHEQIRQIVASPNGAFLAVVADHTVFIAALPDPSHLSTDSPSIRVKTYQLGPTTHVIPESPVVSALWHPLGVHTNLGGCIVTVTADAAVRVWELDRNNRWSFDRPSLAIDLRKLVDGTSSEQDFSPWGFGRNKGFSADYIDMEVASACFGGSGSGKEDAWAPTTLWVAMKPGDLYALCPLLPSKWKAPATTVPSLSAAIVPKLAALEEDPAEFEEELIACRQQYDWLAEIDNQDPLHIVADPGATGPGSEVYTRPANPSAIPRLQGPFRVDTGDEVDDLDLCDINVIAAKVDTDALMMGEEYELAMENGDDKLSATVISLSTGSGRIHLCLELDGVEGQWLPRAKKNAFRAPLSERSDLILVESLETVREAQQSSKNWPTFTKDIHSRYDFFVTNEKNVTFISISDWVQRLEAELQAEDPSGCGLRLNVLCEGNPSVREQIIQVENDGGNAQQDHLPSSLVYYDYDLGYLLLTCHASQPLAASLDAPEISLPSFADRSTLDSDDTPRSPVLPPRRPPYQVPAIFYANSPLDLFTTKQVPHHQRQGLREQVRLSPATLDLVAAAHRILSSYTNNMERAVSDLFRRCERLQGELQDQVKQLSDVAERIKGVSSEVTENGEYKKGSRNNEALDTRLQAARDRQVQLVKRYESIRTKVLNSGGRPLSEKETQWVSEVGTLSNLLGESKRSEEDIEEGEIVEDGQLPHRLDAVKQVASDLLDEAKAFEVKSPTPTDPGSPATPGSYADTTLSSSQMGGQPRIPPRLQRAKIADAMRMVEREAAVIDAITARLGRLNTNL